MARTTRARNLVNLNSAEVFNDDEGRGLKPKRSLTKLCRFPTQTRPSDLLRAKRSTPAARHDYSFAQYTVITIMFLVDYFIKNWSSMRYTDRLARSLVGFYYIGSVRVNAISCFCNKNCINHSHFTKLFLHHMVSTMQIMVNCLC